jgi:hypothetical protein
MKTSLSLHSICCNLDPYNPDDQELVLNRFKEICDDLRRHSHSHHHHTDPFLYYRGQDWAQCILKSLKEFKELEDVVSMIPVDDFAQAHSFDTYACSFKHDLFLIGFHYPLTSSRYRPMQVDRDGNFCEPSLKAFFADIWIAILEKNINCDHDRKLSLCLTCYYLKHVDCYVYRLDPMLLRLPLLDADPAYI